MRVASLLFLIATFSFVAGAQNAAQNGPAFEAASIRPPENPTRDGKGFSDVGIPDAGHLRAQNSTLDELIRYAWNLKDHQVSGPAWLNDSTIAFDIAASAPPDTSRDQMKLLLRTLLEDRFGLVTHSETRVFSGYELTLGKKGAKLKPADPAGRKSSGGYGDTLVDTNATMANFADHLARNLKVPVVDKTGIAGRFDITFRYAENPDATSSPSLFTALEDATGLRLQAAKVPVSILVVDHVAKVPTAN